MCITSIAGIAVESVFKFSFVFKGTQTRPKGQYKAELTLLPHNFCVKQLITAITDIAFMYVDQPRLVQVQAKDKNV